MSQEESKDAEEKSVNGDWQIDSEWIDFSSSEKIKPEQFPSFTFEPASNNELSLVIENESYRLRQKKQSGYSYWECAVPFCRSRCLLDADEKCIIRYSGEHNHDAELAKNQYKSFLSVLKLSVKENPHLKPEELYTREVEQYKSKGFTLFPSYDTVKAAMGNSRNSILFSLNLKPAEDSTKKYEEMEKMTISLCDRTTRSGGKRKSTPNNSDSDLKELENDWKSDQYKDASLSDLEDLLDSEKLTSDVHVVTSTRSKESPPVSSFVVQLDEPAKSVVVKDPLTDNGNEANTDASPRRKYRKRPASSSVFTCPHCPYKSNRHFNVQRHERLAHSTRKPEFSCKECGTSYSLEYRLKLHIKAVHQGEGHHCHICSRNFETMTGLKSHMMTKHRDEDPKAPRDPPPLDLTCNLCGRVFTSKLHLVKHQSSHIMIQPYRCCVCNATFLEECLWLTHQNSCTDSFTIQCSLCSSIIPTAHDLLEHMDVVHGRAEYACRCGKTFPWKKSLLTHQQKCSFYISERISTA